MLQGWRAWAALLVVLVLAPAGGWSTPKKTPHKASSAGRKNAASKRQTGGCVAGRGTAKTRTTKSCGAARPHVQPVKVTAAARAAALRQIELTLRTPPAVPLEQPQGLASFFAQLQALEEHSGPGALHLLQFGDSHTAADEFTGQLRTLLQQRFGDGGAGFSLAGHPFPGYRIHGTTRTQSSGWTTQGTHFRSLDDVELGLAGVAISASGVGEVAALDAESENMELEYLQQPGGGEIALYGDGTLLASIATDGPLGPGRFAAAMPPGEHHFEVRTLTDAPVRLLGWVTENLAGVTYEALGINGAEASLLLRWDESLHRPYLQQRQPALIVLAYGTNEAANQDWTYESYREMFRTLIQRFQQTVPQASILVLGPADRYLRVPRVGWKPYAGTERIVRAQRDTCRELGCTYWDWQRRMGGPGSMRRWAYAQWAQGDYTHFTTEGYRELANALFADLMQEYELFQLQNPLP